MQIVERITSGRWACRALRTPPWAFLVAAMALLILATYAIAEPTPKRSGAYNVAIAIYLISLQLWYLALGIEMERRSVEPRFLRVVLTFALSTFGLIFFASSSLLSVLAYQYEAPDILSIAIVGIYMTNIFTVAGSYTLATSNERRSFLRAITNALLLFYLPVGIWFIKPRLDKMPTVTS